MYTGNACLCHPVGSHLLRPGQLPVRRGEARRSRQSNRTRPRELIASASENSGQERVGRRRRSGYQKTGPLGYRRKRTIRCNGGRCSGSSWLAGLPFLQSENESRSLLSRVTPYLSLCVRRAYQWLSAGDTPRRPCAACTGTCVSSWQETIAGPWTARAAAPIKTLLLEALFVVSSRFAFVLNPELDGRRGDDGSPARRRETRGRKVEKKVCPPSHPPSAVSPSLRNRARSTFRRLTEQKTIDRTRERGLQGFLFP